ncbi:MAG: hypothetical protein KDD44_06760 [Bdellovibrionales bacterium]|nr:hypothetical protein [Bdellovibrionales bacterium]
MSSMTKNFFCFIIGIVLAAGLVISGTLAELVTTFRSSSEKPLAGSSDGRRGDRPDVVVEKSGDVIRDYLASETVSHARRQRIYKDAIRMGTARSLRLLRPDMLRPVESADPRIHRLVEDAVLQGLYARFGDLDLLLWGDPVRRAEVAQWPTPARQYVDTVRLLNPQLGSRAETAALVLFGFHRAIRVGGRFDLTEYLRFASQNADEMLGASSVLVADATPRVQEMLASDRAFRESIAGELGQLTLDLIRRERANVVGQWHAIDGLPAEAPTAERRVLVQTFLRNMLQAASAKQRQDVLLDEYESGGLRKLAHDLPSELRSISHLMLFASIEGASLGEENTAALLIRAAAEYGADPALLDQVRHSLKLSTSAAGLPDPTDLEPLSAPSATTRPGDADSTAAEPKQGPAVDALAPPGAKPGRGSRLLVVLVLAALIGIPAAIIYGLNRARVKPSTASGEARLPEIRINPDWNVGAESQDEPTAPRASVIAETDKNGDRQDSTGDESSSLAERVEVISSADENEAEAAPRTKRRRRKRRSGTSAVNDHSTGDRPRPRGASRPGRPRLQRATS